MNVYHTLDNININNITFYKAILNKLSHYIYFYKIIYSIETFTLNALLIEVDLKDIFIVKEGNSYKVSFTIDPKFLEKIKQFEIKSLDGLNHLLQKQIVHSCFKYLTHSRTVYTFAEPIIKVCLRISGVWESDTHIGLTSKLTCY